jgi:parallel beta-helix repeat protein
LSFPRGAQRAPGRRPLRPLLAAFIAAFLFGIGAVATQPMPVLAGGSKVAIIVGPSGSATATNKLYANAAAREALRYTSNVVKVYSPSATWSRVKAAMTGAAVVVYFGRSRGWPSRYSLTRQALTQDGFGLNPALGGGNQTTRYYGEASIRTVNLAPDAVVLLHPRAYAPGAGEPGRPEPTLTMARERVDNYAAGFMAAGAKYVVADTYKPMAVWYIHQIFGSTTSLDSVWLAAPNRHGHVTTFTSKRTSNAYSRTDPVTVHAGFTRAISVRRAAGSPPPSSSPTKTIRVGPGRTGIKVTKSNTVIDGYSIIGSQATTYNVNEYGIDVEGTASNHLHNIVIRNCYVGKFGNTGIWLQYVDSFTIENCTIEDSVYAGIYVVSGTNGLIRYNHIRRIGVVGYQTKEMNSYGITLSDFGLGLGPSSNVRILSNVITDVPQWHGIDTHGGTYITISGNTVLRTNRAIFLTTSPNGRRASHITVNGNTLAQPTPRVDMIGTYPYNEYAITVYAVDGVVGTGNRLDSWPRGNEVNVAGGSTSVSVTGSVVTNSR